MKGLPPRRQGAKNPQCFFIFLGVLVPSRLFFYLIILFLSSCSEHGSKREHLRSTDNFYPVLRASDSLPLVVRRLDTLFKTKVGKGFNGNVLIAQKGKVIYRCSFGWTDRKKNKKLSLNDRFQIASTTKTFTSAAILRLYAQKKLSLSDRVEKYVKNFPYRGITIRMLLSHRSGLPEYNYCSEEYFADHDKPVNMDSMISMICTKAPGIYHKPGKKFDYCNTNYILLAKIIETVSGMKYADLLEKEIFIPLGMNDTWVFDPGDSTLPELLKGHDTKWGLKKNNFLDGCVGDKGIYSTVNDLLLFDQALYGKALLPDSLKKLAFEPGSKEFKGVYNYGLGWRILRTDDDLPVVYHNGWWHGFNSCFYRRLADSTTIILLGNKFSKETYRIYGILGILDNKQSSDDKEIGEEDTEKKEDH